MLSASGAPLEQGPQQGRVLRAESGRDALLSWFDHRRPAGTDRGANSAISVMAQPPPSPRNASTRHSSGGPPQAFRA